MGSHRSTTYLDKILVAHLRIHKFFHNSGKPPCIYRQSNKAHPVVRSLLPAWTSQFALSSSRKMVSCLHLFENFLCQHLRGWLTCLLSTYRPESRYSCCFASVPSSRADRHMRAYRETGAHQQRRRLVITSRSSYKE